MTDVEMSNETAATASAATPPPAAAEPVADPPAEATVDDDGGAAEPEVEVSSPPENDGPTEKGDDAPAVAPADSAVADAPTVTGDAPTAGDGTRRGGDRNNNNNNNKGKRERGGGGRGRGRDGGRDRGRDGERGRGREEDRTPIEELYDLSKPIKRVDRPMKEDHEAELIAIDAAVETFKEERRSLQKKIDAALGLGNGGGVAGRERDALNRLKNRKGKLIEEKRRVREKLDGARRIADRLQAESRAARKEMGKQTTVADIDAEVKRLQRKQETVSMSLSDEKKLVRDIDVLHLSRRTAAALTAREGDIDAAKDGKRAAQAELAAKDKEIDALQRDVDAKSKVVKEISQKQDNAQEKVDGLRREQDAVKAKIDENHKLKNELRKQFRNSNNEWYDCQRAIKAQRDIQFEEERRKHAEEKKEWIKQQEEEELKKIPYEEEMALCDYLADYLAAAYLTDPEEEKRKKKEEADKKAAEEVIAVSARGGEDPFAGMMAMKKGGDDQVYFGKGKGGKKQKQKEKQKPKAAPSAASFRLNIDSFEQFGLLSLNPPTSNDAVQGSVDELRAKKEWYSKQPRGSVPTAKDVRKANERAAAKVNGGGGGKSNGAKNEGGKKGKFSILSEDFAPLAGGPTTATTEKDNFLSWGK